MITADNINRIITMTRQGRSTKDIAAAIGVTERSISRVRKRAGIAQPAAAPLTADELAKARQLLEDGASQKDVAQTLGRASATIAKHFPDHKWTQAQCADHQRLRRIEDSLTAPHTTVGEAR